MFWGMFRGMFRGICSCFRCIVGVCFACAFLGMFQGCLGYASRMCDTSALLQNTPPPKKKKKQTEQTSGLDVAGFVSHVIGIPSTV